MSIIGFSPGAFSDGGGGGPESVESPLAALAADPTRIPLYLVIASPYDPDTAATTNLYYSTGAFTSASSDDPPSQAFTEDRISVPVRLSNRLNLERGTLRATGTTAGDIEFFTLDGGADALATYLWDGRDVEVLIGFPGYTLAQCAEIFKGTAEGAAWDRRTVRVRLRSPRFKLERDVQTTLYEGATTVTATDIGFAATDTITSTSTDLSVFVAGRLIEVVGSAGQDGYYVVGSSSATSITLSAGTVTTEAAGASITVRTTLEGGDELEGKRKPLAYGQVRQVAPVLVNGTLLIYQAHAGSLEAVNAVRDRGVVLSFSANYASGRLLAAATVAAGDYATCLAEGLIRLGDSPGGIVTCDVQGDDSGTLGASGYTSTAADIVRKIVTTKGALTDPDDLDTGSFSDLNTTTSAVVGVATGLDRVSIAAVVDSVADSVGAFIDFTLNGRLRVRRLEDPSTATASHTITSIEPDSWSGQNADIPAHTVKLGYRHYPKTLSGEEAASSLADSTRLDYGQPYRDTTSEDSTILTLHPSAALYEVQTLLDASADAATEAARRLAMYKPTRHVYEVQVWNGLYAYALGDVVTFQISRYDLTSGKKFAVIGIDEEPIQSENHQNIATLRLWGREN